jgi:hypothetical protein
VHTDLGGQPWSLVRRPDAGTGRRWLGPALGVVAAAAGVVAAARWSRHGKGRMA